jgi:hypothetical protein
MPGVRLWLLVALHRLQNFEPHVGPRTGEVLPSVYEPLEGADEQNYPERDYTIV